MSETCKRCNKPLHVDKSKHRGYGLSCAKKEGIIITKKQKIKEEINCHKLSEFE